MKNIRLRKILNLIRTSRLFSLCAVALPLAHVVNTTYAPAEPIPVSTPVVVNVPIYKYDTIQTPCDTVICDTLRLPAQIIIHDSIRPCEDLLFDSITSIGVSHFDSAGNASVFIANTNKRIQINHRLHVQALHEEIFCKPKK